MGIRGVATLALALLLSGCGGGSGRQGSDLVVTGTGPSAQLSAGDAANFTMTVKNAGDNDATGVTISNHVVGLQLTGTTCKASGGVTCPSTTTGSMSVGDMPAGSSLTFQVTATVPQNGTGEVTIQDTMTADYSEDIDRSNNTATVNGSAYIANAAVSVTGTAPAGVVAAGSTAVFSFTVHNAGPDAAAGPDATNTLQVTAGVSNSAHGTTISCSANGGAICPSSLVSPITVTQLPSGGSLIFNVSATVDQDANGQVEATLSAKSKTYDPDSSDNTLTLNATASTSTDLSVTETGAANVAAGQVAQFQATVLNGGTSSLSNVTVNQVLNQAYAVTVTCASSPVGQCPSPLGQAIAIPTLRAGTVLTFTYSVTLPTSARGAVTSQVTVAAVGDTNTGNNSASFTTQAVDARSGTYQVFGADGQQYQLNLDFDAGTYSVADANGQSLSGESGSIAAFNNPSNGSDPANGDYLFDGNAGRRVRVGTDLIVGQYPLGGGAAVPFIAARSFITSALTVANLGSFDLATLDTDSSATRTTHAGTANLSTTLVLCQSDAGVDRVTNCPGAVKNYSLQAPATGGTAFSAVNTADATDTFNFVIARSGTLTLLISASVDGSGNRELRIGVPDSVGGLTNGGPGFNGPSTSGDWLHMAVTSATYIGTVINGSGSQHSVGGLAPISASAGPFSMLRGLLDANPSSPVFVVQAYPLTIVIGDFGGDQSGLYELGLP